MLRPINILQKLNQHHDTVRRIAGFLWTLWEWLQQPAPSLRRQIVDDANVILCSPQIPERAQGLTSFVPIFSFWWNPILAQVSKNIFHVNLISTYHDNSLRLPSNRILPMQPPPYDRFIFNNIIHAYLSLTNVTKKDNACSSIRFYSKLIWFDVIVIHLYLLLQTWVTLFLRKMVENSNQSLLSGQVDQYHQTFNVL